jgi:Na+-translocating ferredoxin:NAD+ oxidoreductase RnfG subunit
LIQVKTKCAKFLKKVIPTQLFENPLQENPTQVEVKSKAGKVGKTGKARREIKKDAIDLPMSKHKGFKNM